MFDKDKDSPIHLNIQYNITFNNAATIFYFAKRYEQTCI